MIAQEAIGYLDAALAKSGETVRLLRMATPPATGVAFTVTTKAILRGYNPAEYVQGSGIAQQDQLAIISPTAILIAAWPGVGMSPIPKLSDRVVCASGRVMSVQAAVGFYVADTLVRIEMQLRGAG